MYSLSQEHEVPMSVILKQKPLAEQVIVITGASSGIGLTTALAAAKKGAKVVLASRNEMALVDICAKIKHKGGTAVYVVADVANRGEIDAIVQKAVDEFGGFDTWVNDAGIGTLGRLDQISEEDHKRLFDTNFWGIVNGSLAAVAHLREKGGTIINLGSEVSDAAVPLQGMYAASKHAVKGFTNSLRIELEEEAAPISLTLIKPAAIATPFFDHAKNYTDREFKAPAPVYAPQEVANAILHAATHPTREVYIGGASKFMAGLQAHTPTFYEWFSSKFMVKAQQGDGRPHTRNNLHEAGDDGYINGRNEGAQSGRKSLYTRASLHPVATSAALAGIALVGFALFKGGRTRKAALGAAGFIAPFLQDKLSKTALPKMKKIHIPKLGTIEDIEKNLRKRAA